MICLFLLVSCHCGSPIHSTIGFEDTRAILTKEGADYRTIYLVRWGLHLQGIMVAMVVGVPFQGFSQKTFDSCKASPSINNVRDTLEHLRQTIEPEMKKLNHGLNGKVSEAKQRMGGYVDWTDWAWLMFTLAPLGSSKSSRPGKPIGASKFTQLTVNISKDRLYVGLYLQITEERSLQMNLSRPENEVPFDEITQSLSGRRWIITRKDDYFSEETARFFSSDDLRGKLLDPRLKWINAAFSRHDEAIQKPEVSTEIMRVFRELYNLFALATASPAIVQPKPSKTPPKTLQILMDKPSDKAPSDEEEIRNTLGFLEKLEMKEMPSVISVPGKTDSYPVERIALPLNLSPRVFQLPSGQTEYWLDAEYSEVEIAQRVGPLMELRSKLDRIALALGKSPEFFQVMITSPKTDARYVDSNRVLVNLLRHERNRFIDFWLFAIAREIAYMRYRRLSYQHIDFMRSVLLAALSRLRTEAL